MKGTKTVFKLFTIVQYRQEEAYLSAMHGRGWKLSHVTFPGFYHFDRCEPEEVSYRLDYNPDGTHDKAEYVQMFSDCGWDYLLDFTGYSYFRKKCAPGEGREEIFSDDSSRLDMMRRVMRHRGRTLIILFAGIILPRFFTQTVGFSSGLHVQVKTERGEPLFYGNCDFALEIPADGLYKIICSGRRAKGTVRLVI